MAEKECLFPRKSYQAHGGYPSILAISAVKLHAANLAAGDLFGSSLTNMAILALVALVSIAPAERERERWVAANLSAIVLAIGLTVLAIVFTLVHTNLGFARLRPESLSLLLIWLLGTRAMFKREQATSDTPNATASTGEPFDYWPLLGAAALFIVGAGLIFLAAPRFASAAQRFANASGLGESFVGTWMVGFSTALPELATAITATRLGAFDLAVANLYGSCAFNMVVFFAMDLASPHVSVFSLLDPSLALSGLLGVVLMFIGLGVILYRRHRPLMPHPAGGLLLASYAFSIWIAYSWR